MLVNVSAAVVDALSPAWSTNLVNACSPTVVHGILLKLQLFGTARPPSTTEGTTVNTTKQPLATRDNRSNKVLQQGGGALLKSPVEEPGAEGRLQATRLLGFNRVLQQGVRVRPPAALGYETLGRPERPATLGYETFGRPEALQQETSTGRRRPVEAPC